MRIYQDSELPDVSAKWGEPDCGGGTGNVALTLRGVDTPSTVELSVPCAEYGATFVDVAPERYRLEAVLTNESGTIFNRFVDPTEVDLHAGLDRSVFVSFLDGFANTVVSWIIEGGDTCESLSAYFVTAQFKESGIPSRENIGGCVQAPLYTRLVAGSYAVQLSAGNGQTIAATSAESAELEVTESGLTDFGVLVLVPCAPCF